MQNLITITIALDELMPEQLAALYHMAEGPTQRGRISEMLRATVGADEAAALIVAARPDMQPA